MTEQHAVARLTDCNIDQLLSTIRFSRPEGIEVVDDDRETGSIRRPPVLALCAVGQAVVERSEVAAEVRREVGRGGDRPVHPGGVPTTGVYLDDPVAQVSKGCSLRFRCTVFEGLAEFRAADFTHATVDFASAVFPEGTRDLLRGTKMTRNSAGTLPSELKEPVLIVDSF